MSSLRFIEKEWMDLPLSSPLTRPDYSVGNLSIPILHIQSRGGWRSSVKGDFAKRDADRCSTIQFDVPNMTDPTSEYVTAAGNQENDAT